LTTHIAALEENKIADSGSVYCAEGF